MANRFLPQKNAEEGSANGFIVRDLIRFFIVDITIIAAQKLLLALGFFARPDTYVLAVLGGKVILFVYLVWLIGARRGAWRQTGIATPGRWWAWPVALLVYAVAYPVMLQADQLSHRLMTGLYAAFGWIYTPAPQDVVLLIFENVLDAPARIALVVFAVLAGPFMEELAFRGMGMDGFGREMGTPAAALWTSVLFGLYHFSLPLFLPLSLMGALFAAVRIFSRTLWCPFFLHCFHNSLALAITAHGLGFFTFGRDMP